MRSRMKLVIVESPSKAKTIEKYLGDGFTVRASVGHIRDLPKSNKDAVDVENGLKPRYQIVPAKQKVIGGKGMSDLGGLSVYLQADRTDWDSLRLPDPDLPLRVAGVLFQCCPDACRIWIHGERQQVGHVRRKVGNAHDHWPDAADFGCDACWASLL